ncbi:hypothetical protein GH157_06090 [archaeon]|nr:hypothetical protein [archaeon]
MLDVALACNMHDVLGSLREIIPLHFSLLSKIYNGMYVVVTSATDPATVKELEKVGVNVEVQEEGGVGLQYISDARRQALRAGLRNGHGHTHFVEVDRLMQWVGNYPEELAFVVKQIPEHDFLVIGRTNRAFDTHTRCQIETEGLTNRVVSLLTGREIDYTCASRGMSREASEIILKHSKTEYAGTDGEWPVIIHCCTDFPIDYVAAEGMEFEIRFRFPDRVKKAGDIEAYKKGRDTSPASWLHRIRTAEQISATAISTYDELCKNT